MEESLLIDVLRIKGYGWTEDRKMLVQVLSRSQAKTAKMLSQETKLSRVTIYRILKTFQEAKIIHWSPEAEGYFACAKILQKKPHAHVICKKCHWTREFNPPETITIPIPGFSQLDARQEWVGLCYDCARK